MEFAELISPMLSKTKVYVTGGFKTVGAMVAATATIGGVGLGRPLCQEPLLCKSILDGHVLGAIEQGVDEQNYGLTNVLAGSQIRRIAVGEEPLDMSQENNVAKFMEAFSEWSDRSAKDGELQGYGYVDLTPVAG